MAEVALGVQVAGQLLQGISLAIELLKNFRRAAKDYDGNVEEVQFMMEVGKCDRLFFNLTDTRVTRVPIQLPKISSATSNTSISQMALITGCRHND